MAGTLRGAADGWMLSTLGGGSLGGLIVKKVSRVRMAVTSAGSVNVVKGTGWGRAFDLVDEILN